MLILEDLLNKMKVHFPRWMDIRRKINKSTGGLYLTSIAEDICDIQSAIEEYKTDFFLDKYIGNEDDIITYLYKSNIGNVEIEKLSLLSPEYKITTDENEFYDGKDIAYYNDGIIYFKEEIKEFVYVIDNYKSTLETEKMHVWNIFDEFAVFLGLRRFQWESNKELLNRILAFSNTKVNSTEDGIKNAILANLINIDPSLTKEEIKIERPTAENLVKYYDKAESILDHLSTVNRDVYRTKKWDIDTWNFEHKSIDYIPHAWDVALSSYTNGIGFKEDLEVNIIDDNSTTDVTISFYNKKLELLNTYLKNHSINETYKLELKKFDDDLQVDEVKYKITASEALKLDVNNINISLHENKTGIFEVPIQDIVDEFIFGFEEQDAGILNDEFNYKVELKPRNEIGEFRIDKLAQVNLDTDESTNLLRYNTPGFTKVNNSLISSYTKKYIVDNYQFSSSYNSKKTIKGFEIDDLSEAATYTLNINGCSNSNLYYDYDYTEVPVLLSSIKRNNCYIVGDYIIADTVQDPKYIEINIKANTFSAEIEGPYSIQYSVNNGELIAIGDSSNTKYKFSIDGFNSPQDLYIRIDLLEKGEACKIKNIMYSKFELEMKTKHGDFYPDLNGSRLPNIDKNELYISMKSFIGISPVIKYIYIGEKLNERAAYPTVDFITDNGSKLIVEAENCIINISKINKSNGYIIETYEDYKPCKNYTATSPGAQLILNLDDFTDISDMYSNNGTLESNSYGDDYIEHILKVPVGETVSSITIEGSINKLISNKSLKTILNSKGFSYSENDFYIAKNSDEIIIKNTISNSLRYTNITREDLFDNYNITSIKIIPTKMDITTPQGIIQIENIQAKFIELSPDKTSQKKITIANSIDSYFDYLTFTPVESKIYTAINKCNIIFPYNDGIKIVNTFNNGFDATSKNKLFYTVESLHEDYFVRFESDNDVFEKWQNKSLDNDTLAIKRKVVEDMNYNYSLLTVEAELPLGSTIDLPSTFIMANNDKIDLHKYMITNIADEDINYLNKYSDAASSEDYVVNETLYVDNTRFSKLKYCNVHEIETINNRTDGISAGLRKDVDYKLLSKEGIIIWLNESLIENWATIKIRYNINKAVSFNVPLNELYKKIQYPVDSLELINTVKLEKISNNSEIDLSIYPSYSSLFNDEGDMEGRIIVHCSNPGFNVEQKDDSLIFSKNLVDNTVAVKTGYYYMDGSEYYLFADENFENIEKIDDVYFSNVTKDNHQFLLKQATTNFVTNSALRANKKGEVFKLECDKKDIQSVSDLKAISACDSFNYWNTFGSNLKIVSGLNGQGIQVSTINGVTGYAFLNISHFLKSEEEYTLSFYLKGSAKAYLGKERKISSANTEFNQRSLIDIVREIPQSTIEDNIFETTFNHENKEDYFLIIQGNGIVDDIIVTKTANYVVGTHKKNISHLNLDFEENIYVQYNTRLFLTEKEGSVFDGTEINSDNYVINSSHLQWGFTKIKEISSYEDFQKCTLNNISFNQYNNKCIVKTDDLSGSILSNPIYVGNTKTIKNLLFKINDIMFDNMKGFKVSILTSNSTTSNFKKVSQHIDNIGAIDGDKLLSYVKIMVEMPSDKVINNIELFIEYLSNEVDTPAEMPTLSGSYTSKVLDAQYNERYHIKNLNIEGQNYDIKNYIFEIRASKENDEKTVWTDWKTINLKSNYDDINNSDIIKNGNIQNRIVFEGYRYFQFRLTLKGEDALIKINHIDLEVI